MINAACARIFREIFGIFLNFENKFNFNVSIFSSVKKGVLIMMYFNNKKYKIVCLPYIKMKKNSGGKKYDLYYTYH